MRKLFRRLTAPIREWADRNPVVATLSLVILAMGLGGVAVTKVVVVYLLGG